MIGILIIAHGNLGESLIDCVSHVLSKTPPQLKSLAVGTNQDIQRVQFDIDVKKSAKALNVDSFKCVHCCFPYAANVCTVLQLEQTEL